VSQKIGSSQVSFFLLIGLKSGSTARRESAISEDQAQKTKPRRTRRRPHIRSVPKVRMGLGSNVRRL
jgi:hypothetical protein